MAWPKGRPKENLVDRRFGRLVVVRQTRARIEGSIAWECLCDCGNKRLVRSSALKSGNTKSCGCLQKERQRSAVALDVGEAAFRRLYRSYKRNAKNKGRKFNIDEDDFRQLTSGDCFYCGSGTTNVLSEAPFNGVYPYNGLDRVNTAGGYTLDNVVSCCKHCNIAKRAMSQQEFARWASRLYNHWAEDFVD